MKLFKLFCAFFGVTLIVSTTAFAGAEANVTKMHEMVVQGYEVVSVLGEEAYEGINNPQGEFVWKNADGSKNNVGVIDCAKGIIAADYEVPGLSINEIKDAKTGEVVLQGLCENRSSEGTWIDFFWNDAGRGNNAHRAILFYIPIKDQPLLVYSFAWDDNTSLEQLNQD